MIRYSLEFSLGGADNHRYKQSFIGSIVLVYNTGKSEAEIGQIYIDRRYSVLIRTTDRTTLNLRYGADLLDTGSAIWDFEAHGVVKPCLRFFECGLIDPDVLYIHTIEILPEYHGMQIGGQAVKDAANNFEQGCSLIITHCLSIQHTNRGRNDKEGQKKMQYDLFEEGKRTAKQQVVRYQSAPVSIACLKYRSRTCSSARCGETRILSTLNWDKND